MNHKLVLCFTTILLILFFSYVFFVQHEVTLSQQWKTAFLNNQVAKNTIDSLTHDEHVWSHDGVSTCVCYGGDFMAKCDPTNCVCAGGNTFGDYYEQVLAVTSALNNKGEHPSCPTFYYGTM